MRRVTATRYPRFLFGGSVPHDEIPIFIYHDVTPDGFRADLEYLHGNGYRCLRTSEYMDCRLSGVIPPRSLLLTFDDAVENFHEVTFPLLREFSVPATLFVPTFWMREAREAPATAEVDPAERDAFMTWTQLRECAASGLVDVQLHGHRHALIHTSSRPAGFATPELLRRHHLFDWPMRHEEGRDRLGRPPPGTPIYESRPLLGAGFRLIEDDEATRACREHVAAAGGTAFFGRPGWRRELDAVLRRSQRSGRTPRTVTGGEFRSFVATEFQTSAELFTEEMGVHPRYLAYPWQLGSDISLELAAACGIEAVFGVGIDHRRISRLRGPLPAASRIKGDWLRFLPGRGRRRLRDVVPDKLRGFVDSQHLAH